MNNNNLQQWWENTYRHHQLKHAFESTEFQFHALDQNTLDSKSIEIASQLKSSIDDNWSSNISVNPYDFDADENVIPSLTLLLMAISYGFVVFGGVLGNATLVLTLCSASSVRLRNPLLLAVCVADLFVTGISAPVTLLNLALNRKTKTLPLVVCKIIHYIQVGIAK